MIRNTAQRLMLTGFGLFAPALALAQSLANPELAFDPVAMAAVEGFNRQSMTGMMGLVIIIVAGLVFATLRERRKQDLLGRFAEKGQEVPRELLPLPPSPEREMRRGVWVFSLGLGLGLVLYISTADWTIAAWSLILLFLGAASFINAALFYPKSGPHQ